MKRIAIFYCKRIKDHSCVACIKCHKGIREKNGEFARHAEEIDLCSMTDCGDCPGLIFPRAGLVMGMLDKMDRKADAIHLGTCIKLASETGNCPMDLDKIKAGLETKFGIPVTIGTHAYV